MPPKKNQNQVQSGGGAVEALVTPMALLLGKQSFEFYIRNQEQQQQDKVSQTNTIPRSQSGTRGRAAPVRQGGRKGGNPKSPQNPNQQNSEGAYLAQGGNNKKGKTSRS